MVSHPPDESPPRAEPGTTGAGHSAWTQGAHWRRKEGRREGSLRLLPPPPVPGHSSALRYPSRPGGPRPIPPEAPPDRDDSARMAVAGAPGGPGTESLGGAPASPIHRNTHSCQGPGRRGHPLWPTVHLGKLRRASVQRQQPAKCASPRLRQARGPGRAGLTQGPVGPKRQSSGLGPPCSDLRANHVTADEESQTGLSGASRGGGLGRNRPCLHGTSVYPSRGRGPRNQEAEAGGQAPALRRTRVEGPSWAPGELRFRGTSPSRRLAGCGARWEPHGVGRPGQPTGRPSSSTVCLSRPGMRARDRAPGQRGTQQESSEAAAARSRLRRAVGAVATSVCPHCRPAGRPVRT